MGSYLTDHSLKIDEITREIVIFTPNSKLQTSAKEADFKRKRLLKKKVCAVVFKVQRKFLHSSIKMFINFREMYSKSTHTTEQVDNPPLRYASVISHACVAFVLVASLKR